MKPILEEFRELVGIDCASGKERMLADVLKRKLEALGFTVREDEAGRTFGGDTGNLIAILPGTRKGSVLFCSHMDRVKNGHGIKVREKDGVLYSGGDTILAADDVSGICAILDGVRRTLSSGNPHPRIEIAFTVGEEAGLFGGKALDLSVFQSSCCFVLDSPGLLGRLVNGAPGHVRFAIHVKGKPAHAAACPWKGANALSGVQLMFHAVDMMRLHFKDYSRVHGIITEGGVAHNTITDEAKAVFNIRSLEYDYMMEMVDAIRSLLSIGQPVTIEGLGTFHTSLTSPGFERPEQVTPGKVSVSRVYFVACPEFSREVKKMKCMRIPFNLYMPEEMLTKEMKKADREQEREEYDRMVAPEIDEEVQE